MKSALLVAAKSIQISDAPIPRPAAEEVLIRPMCVGICGSDVSFFTGHREPPKYPIQLGHECVGRIEAVGAQVSELSVGQRVIIEPNYPCGRCEYCRTGRGNICPNKKVFGMTLPGCFADRVVAPAKFVWPMPEPISDEDAVTIEPLAVSLHALWQSGARIGDAIAVIGCGSTGLLLVHAAVAQGMRVFAHDRFQAKVAMAREFGAEEANSEDLGQVWKDAGVVRIFECAGASSTVELALNGVPRGGQVILLGLSSSPATFVPLRFVREGVSVSGSIIYDHPHDFRKAIDLVGRGVLSPGRIITETFDFAHIADALKLASTGESGKVIVTMD